MSATRFMMCLTSFSCQVSAAETWQLNEVRHIMKRVADIDPKFESAFYNLGAMDTLSAYRPYYEARAKDGIPENDSAGLKDKEQRTLRERISPLLEEAIISLKHALDLEPADSDAMKYLAVCWNMKAELADAPAA